MLKMLQLVCLTLTGKIRAFMQEEKGAVDIVAIVVMIGIAVLLAIVFKDAITELLNNLFSKIAGNATGAVGG